MDHMSQKQHFKHIFFYCLIIKTCASEIQVTLGAHKINEAEDTQVKITTDAYTMHSGWDATQIINDIAVIDLKQEIELTENIQPGNLPTYADVANEITDSVARVSGWGLDSDSSDSISPVLREVYAIYLIYLISCDFYHYKVFDKKKFNF
ncbi:chymotrypsin-like [Onthophagus taurus]|uniref:chymotrypsin-like n=1 Tax=Onthophagus taurus TaxID=166361 RepID=UPI0039BDB5EB